MEVLRCRRSNRLWRAEEWTLHGCNAVPLGTCLGDEEEDHAAGLRPTPELRVERDGVGVRDARERATGKGNCGRNPQQDPADWGGHHARVYRRTSTMAPSCNGR